MTTVARIRRILHGMALLVRLLWACSPALTVVGAVAAVARALAAAVLMLASGRLVGALADGRLDQRWLVLTLTALVLQTVLAAVVDVVGVVEQGRATPLLLERVSTLASRPHGIEHLEQSDVRQAIDGAVEEINQQYFLGVQSTWQVVGYRIWGIAALAVLASWSWWVAAVVLAATLAVNLTWSAYSQQIFEQIFRDRRRRRARWYRNLLVDQDSAKEVRLFGLTDFGLERFAQSWHVALADLWQGRRAEQRPIVIANVAVLAAYVVALAALAHDAWTGVIGTATLLAASQALMQMEGLGMLGDMQTMCIRQQALLLDLEDLDRRLPAASEVAAPTRPTGKPGAVSLRDVRFTYPGRTEPTFDRLTLEIEPGSSVAVVGENGAGKSTLVKLLTGLYRPSSGRLLVDDVDLADFDGDAWRARCAGAFQDHLHLELLARETITTGDLPALDSDDRALRALDDAAAGDVMVALPGGLATQLGTSWDDGTELSGGQWQRLAIARGMMRGDPLLLVLDEPTSALDAATEHALFEGYADAARRAGRHGAVTVLVTHRFSTVAAADLVVVLADGRVSEVGSHAELMAAGGGYAQLYALQARGYA